MKLPPVFLFVKDARKRGMVCGIARIACGYAHKASRAVQRISLAISEIPFWHRFWSTLVVNVKQKMKVKTIITLIAGVMTIEEAAAQGDSLRLTLSDAIALAQQQSSDALAAKHSLEAAEWSYRNHQANYLPAVTLSSAPSLNRQMNSITQPDGVPALPQTNLEITACTSAYTFRNDKITLQADFTSPLLLDDLAIASRPVSYLKLSAVSNDGAAHTIQLQITMDDCVCLNKKFQYPTVYTPLDVLHLVGTGSAESFDVAIIPHFVLRHWRSLR